jgi:superfamily I DNA and RNA helicase
MILAIIFLVIEYQKSTNNKELMSNHAFTTGQFSGEIIQYKKGSNGPWYICNYKVNGKTYTVSEPIHLCRKLENDLFMRSFPIVYDSTNPGIARVLVFPFEFEELNLEYPDSLKWIIEKQ